MSDKLAKLAGSDRPSWTLSTDATSFIDDGKKLRLHHPNTQRSASPGPAASDRKSLRFRQL